jgi:hypothetical protein
MKETEKQSMRAVAILLCIFVAFVASAGAISTLEPIYVICGILNALIAAWIIYKKIKES